VQRIERGGTGRQLLAVSRELEARIDALPPDVGEVIDEEACQIARLLGGAECAERGLNVFVERWRETRPLGKKRPADDTKRQARIATLQEADGGLDRFDVTLGIREEVGDRRRHRGASACRLGSLAQFFRHARHERR
jgi:hypothetical protein